MAQHSLYSGLLSRKVILGTTLGGAVAFMVIGVLIWGGFNWAMEATNTEKFCITCHEMKDNVYVEYVGTVHDANRSGVPATCPDCHVPRPWVHKIVRKIQASNEILHKILGTVDTPEKFNAERLTLAKRVWDAMKQTDSRECRNCHDWDTMNPERQKPRARQQHLNAMEKGNTCIDCHKGIAHTKVHDKLSEEDLEKLAAPNPTLAVPVPESFKQGMAKVAAAEAAAESKRQEDTRKEREAKQAAKEAEQKRIDEAVAKALAAQQGKQAAPAPGGAPSAPAAPAAVGGATTKGFGVDWKGVPERLITLFYPGQTSMEWTLVGKFHGGARPFMDGDRCFTCHDKETAAMGRKMVTGEKAEPTPPVGKRGDVPVTVQAAHDQEYLYLRFQWPDTPHVAVPFVDGGKMDPQNQVKLAVMLATDDVIYAGQSGCWGTCHHDLRTMPDHPENAAAAGLPLDMSKGVTKYIKESRTEVEEKGRRGAKLGGWDKLKAAGDIQAELTAGHFLDLMRWNSSGRVENGHVLDQRVLAEGAGLEAEGWLDGGTWTVVMRRKLGATQPGDLSIEPGKTYNFGFAIHDDYTNARFHHVSLGYKLALDNAGVEVNAVKASVQAAAAVPAAAPVAAAPAPAVGAAPAAPAVAAGGAVDAGVDWSKASDRLITLFYPGQTSMEWTLVGKFHGGARPFMDGDRCFTCHDKETAAMGRKMVTGEKAEPTPPVGKRGDIPVTVQATHDKENLYLRFQWAGTDHVPVPFVEGGKMDPQNQVKLAVMLATDDVIYAGQSGCWGTCHHDLRTMPDHPENAAAAGLPLDMSKGVTKYIKESRTEVEEKGRRGAKLGGWDKLKAAGDVQAELTAGHFLDLLRVNSGDGSTEDGHVLDQRNMKGGQGFQAQIKEEGGQWTLVLKRKLAATQPGDLSIEPGKVYNFGFAIHDDYTNARFHHVSLGYKLGLDQPQAELNATAQ